MKESHAVAADAQPSAIAPNHALTALGVEPATAADAPALAALHNIVAADLTARFGCGGWSSQVTERGIRFEQRHGTFYVVRDAGKIIGKFRLATKKPWAIDRRYFTPCPRPLYLTSMAVQPAQQRRGIGRRCIAAARLAAQAFPAQAIWLDAFDAPAGAGEFYRKCGFAEKARATYRGTSLLYFELPV